MTCREDYGTSWCYHAPGLTAVPVVPVRSHLRQTLASLVASVGKPVVLDRSRSFPSFSIVAAIILAAVVSAGVFGQTPTAPILILGEPGSGKELVARAIQARGPRQCGRMQGLHCGSLAGELFESELFGCEPGAFTGAGEGRSGILETADHVEIIHERRRPDDQRVAELQPQITCGEVHPFTGPFTGAGRGEPDGTGEISTSGFRSSASFS